MNANRRYFLKVAGLIVWFDAYSVVVFAGFCVASSGFSRLPTLTGSGEADRTAETQRQRRAKNL